MTHPVEQSGTAAAGATRPGWPEIVVALVVQQAYTDAGSAGVWSIILSLVLLAVLTPLGEELVFRGAVYSGLAR